MNTWFALTSYRRATTETEVPGAKDAATISRFNASGHRLLVRPPFVPIINFVDTSTSRAASDQRQDSRGRAALPRRCSAEGYEGKTVESDETFVGGKAKNAHKNKPIPKKHAVVALVERSGQVRAKHVADVTAKTLRAVIAKHVDPKSTMNTDDALACYHKSKEFAKHVAVNHSKGEYVS